MSGEDTIWFVDDDGSSSKKYKGDAAADEWRKRNKE
jgi:hypothetical protein